MKNVMKAATLESKFPLLAVENGCIVSKEADVTVAFRVELPELFSVTGSEYEAIHSAWHKAVKVLPEYSIVHKQDFFIEEKYRPETDRDDLSFLSRSFERHFNERPFLNHFCYLFLTKTTKARSRQESTFSTLCKGRLVPKEIEDRETVTRFLEAVGQFEKIMNDSGFVTLRRLTTDEITGTETAAGIVEKYLSLSQHDTTVLKDIQLNPEEMRIGDDILCLHTLSDTEDLPGKVATDSRYERLSTDRSDCRLSFAAPVGLLLDCNHCYNQYIFIDDHGENLKRFEQTARNMHSLSRYSRSNQINKAWIEEYLNEAHSKGLTSVRCHCNVMAWSDDREELRRIKNEVGSQLALMECKPRHNTVDVPTLFWAAIPGSGSGKSFFMNHLVRQYYEQNSHIVLIDTGNSYQGLCELIHRKTKGEDGIYYTYTEEKPISFNPFFTDDYKFSVEKKDSIKTLLLALWKGEDEKITKTESGELGSAVSAYIRRIQQNRDIVPSFDTFYEYMLNDYRKELAARDIKVSRKDFNIDNFLTTLRQYYKGGRYDFLLNSNENIDLLHKRFIVFEIDSIKDNAELFPVVTIIIMEAFINKLRRLKGVRKMLICEEAWKALSSPSMSEYLKYLYKTVRKYFGEAIVVTQEVDDIISSPIVKEAIITNSDCKILLDQKKYMNKFDGIQSMLGLTDKEKSQILSINLANHPGRKYKEVWIGLNGVQSAVYATEVSAAEYLTYTTEESEKTEVFALAEELGGDLELAIKRLAETKYK